MLDINTPFRSSVNEPRMQLIYLSQSTTTRNSPMYSAIFFLWITAVHEFFMSSTFYQLKTELDYRVFLKRSFKNRSSLGIATSSTKLLEETTTNPIWSAFQIVLRHKLKIKIISITTANRYLALTMRFMCNIIKVNHNFPYYSVSFRFFLHFSCDP